MYEFIEKHNAGIMIFIIKAKKRRLYFHNILIPNTNPQTNDSTIEREREIRTVKASE